MATTSQGLYPLGDTDYATPPGATLRELLEERGMSQRELARRTGLSPKHVNRLLQGLVPLSPDVAQRLELVTGTPARLWNRLEANYRSDLERLRERRDLAACARWLAEMPVSALLKRGVLPDEPDNTSSRVEQMLGFFGVASVDAWEDVYGNLACAFRQSKAFEVKRGAVIAWLAGEGAADSCAPFNGAGLRAAIPDLRALTIEPPEVFGPKMQDICAAHGVAVVFVGEVTGAHARCWALADARQALIQLSLRTEERLSFGTLSTTIMKIVLKAGTHEGQRMVTSHR